MKHISKKQILHVTLASSLFAFFALQTAIAAPAGKAQNARRPSNIKAPPQGRGSDSQTNKTPPPAAKAPASADKYDRLVQLDQENKSAEIIRQFGNEDFATWRTSAGKASAKTDEQIANACQIRAQAYSQTNEPEKAEADMKRAIEFNPTDAGWWYSVGETCSKRNENQLAADAYVQTIKASGMAAGNWMQPDATIKAVDNLCDAMKYDEALKVLQMWKDSDIPKMGAVWGVKVFRAYGQVYAAMGEEEKCLASFKAALELEKKK